MLKVNFINYKNVLIADIVKMHESLRAAGETKTLANNGKYSIKSINCPAIGMNGKVLFVRGNSKDNDWRVAIHDYETQEDAEKARYNFEKMIKEINLKGGLEYV